MIVNLSRPAEDDLAAIYSYYSERDYEHAERVIRAIIRACDGLADFPLLGKQGVVQGTRERLMTRYPYRLVYRIDKQTIFVARILHVRPQWPPQD